MNTVLRIEHAAAIANLGIVAALIARFFITGLIRPYRLFTTYLVVVLIQAATGSVLATGSITYEFLYIATEALQVILSAFVIMEMYAMIFRDLPGLATTGRKYIRYALAISVIVSLGLLAFESASHSFLSNFFVFERVVTTSLLFFVLFLTAFLSLVYPVPISRNIIVFTIGYAVFFLANSASLFLNTAEPYISKLWYHALFVAAQVIEFLCFAFWTVALNAAGETKKVQYGLRWRPEDEDRLLDRIRSMNDTLLRAAKK